LLNHREILGTDRVTAPHLEGKWITVQEFVTHSAPAAAPSRARQVVAVKVPAAETTIPPRPDEKTLSSITAPSSSHPLNQPDTVHDLFDILQAARERQTVHKNSSAHHLLAQLPRPIDDYRASRFLLLGLPLLAFTAYGIWRVSSSSSPSSAGKTEVTS